MEATRGAVKGEPMWLPPPQNAGTDVGVPVGAVVHVDDGEEAVLYALQTAQFSPEEVGRQR